MSLRGFETLREGYEQASPFAVVSGVVVYCGGTERRERKWVWPTFSCTCGQKRAAPDGATPLEGRGRGACQRASGDVTRCVLPYTELERGVGVFLAPSSYSGVNHPAYGRRHSIAGRPFRREGHSRRRAALNWRETLC